MITPSAHNPATFLTQHIHIHIIAQVFFLRNKGLGLSIIFGLKISSLVTITFWSVLMISFSIVIALVCIPQSLLAHCQFYHRTQPFQEYLRLPCENRNNNSEAKGSETRDGLTINAIQEQRSEEEIENYSAKTRLPD